MKDTIITAKTKKRELTFLLISLIAAIVLNITGIIIYNTSWTEIFSQLHVVIILAVIIYLILWIIRGIVMGVSRIAGRRK